MNTCWKCGRVLDAGTTECGHACEKSVSEEEAEQFALFLERFAKRRRLDWSKVQSVRDVICVLSTLFGDATVEPDSAEARKLESYLEPKKDA